MANAMTNTGSVFSKGVLKEIYGEAYKMQYENGMLRHLGKELGRGVKGSLAKFEYFDPSTFAAGGSLLTETTDFTYKYELVNASVIVTASEWGIRTDVTDALKEGMSFDFKSEIARQHGIGVAKAFETHILNAITSGGATTGTVTGTSSSGFSMAHYMAAKARLDAVLLSVPGRKQVVAHPYNWYYTAKTTFASTYGSAMGDIGNDVLKKFYQTTLLGDIDIYLSNYMTAAASTTTWMFAKDALGIWIPRDFRLEQERNASARATEIVSTMRGGAKVLIKSYTARLLQYGTAPTGA